MYRKSWNVLLAAACVLGFQSSVLAATAVDDNYNADNLPFTQGGECNGTGADGTYDLQPSPFANDTFTGQDLANITNFSTTLVSAPQGGFFSAFFNSATGQFRFEYDNSCAGVGSFTVPAIVDYTYEDAADPNAGPTTGRITIQPPSQQPAATTQPDIYSADTSDNEVIVTSGPGTGETTYTLIVSPLDNDTLTSPYNEIATANATDNFTVVSGGGRMQVFFFDNGIEFNHIRSEPFTGPVIVNYDLRDSEGVSIPNTATTITINPPQTSTQIADANDDTYSADNLQEISVNGSVGYVLTPDPLANDTYQTLDSSQTFDDANFVLNSGSGSIVVGLDANENTTFTYFPGGTFDTPAVFTYTLYDSTPDVVLVAKANSASVANRKPSQDTATITINPPSPTIPFQLRKTDNVNVACELETPGENQFCDSFSPQQRVELLSTITAQADSMFDLQSGQIANIRNRMTQNRSGYAALSLSGLNASVFGKHVPVGRIAQAMVNQPRGGGAADDDFGADTMGFFITGNFVAGDKDDSDLNVGYDADGYNLTSGLDFRINNQFIIGGALGIAEEEADFNYDFGDQEIGVQSLALYSNYYTGSAFYVDALFMLTQGDIETTRNLELLSEVANGSTDGSLWSFAATSGYSWNSSSWQVDLYGRLEFTNLQIDSYTENGSSVDLTVEDQDVDSLELAFGGRFAKVFSLSSSVLIPSLDIEILKQFEGDTRFIGVNMETLGTGFGVEDEADDTSYANVGFSLSSVFAGGFSAYFRAESIVADDLRGRTTYGGGLRWEF